MHLLTRLIATALIITAASFVSNDAEAKIFKNSYVSFELPQTWDCKLTDTEWVCRNNAGNAKEAAIILTAKEVGPVDNLQAYEAHLRTPREIPSTLGTPMRSRVISVSQPKINDHVWIDGMHLNSEVRDYYTRYLATVRGKIGVLVTFSAHQKYYSRYVNDFFKAVQSLRVFDVDKMLNNPNRNTNGPGGGNVIGQNTGGLPPVDMGEEFPEEGSGDKSSGTTSWILAIAVILAAGGLYLLIKQKPKRRR